jgi:hypothetical protein
VIETTLLLAALTRVRALRPHLFTHRFFDAIAAAGERRCGRRLWPWAAGPALLLLAGLYVCPATRPAALGKFYVLLASHPFDVDRNVVGFRILTPLISWAVGLRGDLLIVTNLVFAALLLGMVYRYFADRCPRPGDALLAALTLTYSLVTLTSVYYGGYTDSLTYVLLFTMWWGRRRRVLFHLCFLLGLLNRESVAFLVPWFAYLTLREVRPWWRAALDLTIGFGAAFGLYAAFRSWISHGQQIKYTTGFYLSPLAADPLHWIRKSLAFWWLGWLSVFKLLWVFPVAAGVAAWRAGERHLVYSMLLLMVCSLAQMAIAFDSSRMLTMAFPVMVLALEYLLLPAAAKDDGPAVGEGEAEPGGAPECAPGPAPETGVRGWAHWVLFANLFVPQLFTAGTIVEQMYSPLARLLLSLAGAKT